MNKKSISIIKGIVKGTVSQIPVAGPILTSVYDEISSNAMQERRQAWELTVEERLEALNDEDLLTKIKSNQQFATCFLKATQLALLTHQQEKLDLLANAVANSIYTNISDDKMLLFLSWIDRYTVTHIKILALFHDPEGCAKSKGINLNSYAMGSKATLLKEVYPELVDKNKTYLAIIRTLYSDGLLTTDQINITTTGSGMSQSITTGLANEFLRFITSR